MFANVIEIAPAPEGLFVKNEYFEYEGEENEEYERIILFALVKNQDDQNIVMPITRTDFEYIVDADTLISHNREACELHFLNLKDLELFKPPKQKDESTNQSPFL